MGCCIAAAFLISLVRRGWFALFPGRAPEVVLFAPAAVRGQWGEAAVAAPSVPEPAGRSRVRLMSGLALVGAGAVWLVAGVLAMQGRVTHAVACSCCCDTEQVTAWQHVVAHVPAVLALVAGAVLLVRRTASPAPAVVR
jgi:hypothetical protein